MNEQDLAMCLFTFVYHFVSVLLIFLGLSQCLYCKNMYHFLRVFRFIIPVELENAEVMETTP